MNLANGSTTFTLNVVYSDIENALNKVIALDNAVSKLKDSGKGLKLTISTDTKDFFNNFQKNFSPAGGAYKKLATTVQKSAKVIKSDFVKGLGMDTDEITNPMSVAYINNLQDMLSQEEQRLKKTKASYDKYLKNPNNRKNDLLRAAETFQNNSQYFDLNKPPEEYNYGAYKDMFTYASRYLGTLQKIRSATKDGDISTIVSGNQLTQIEAAEQQALNIYKYIADVNKTRKAWLQSEQQSMLSYFGTADYQKKAQDKLGKVDDSIVQYQQNLANIEDLKGQIAGNIKQAIYEETATVRLKVQPEIEEIAEKLHTLAAETHNIEISFTHGGQDISTYLSTIQKDIGTLFAEASAANVPTENLPESELNSAGEKTAVPVPVNIERGDWTVLDELRAVIGDLKAQAVIEVDLKVKNYDSFRAAEVNDWVEEIDKSLADKTQRRAELEAEAAARASQVPAKPAARGTIIDSYARELASAYSDVRQQIQEKAGGNYAQSGKVDAKKIRKLFTSMLLEKSEDGEINPNKEVMSAASDILGKKDSELVAEIKEIIGGLKRVKLPEGATAGKDEYGLPDNLRVGTKAGQDFNDFLSKEMSTYKGRYSKDLEDNAEERKQRHYALNRLQKTNKKLESVNTDIERLQSHRRELLHEPLEEKEVESEEPTQQERVDKSVYEQKIKDLDKSIQATKESKGRAEVRLNSLEKKASEYEQPDISGELGKEFFANFKAYRDEKAEVKENNANPSNPKKEVAFDTIKRMFASAGLYEDETGQLNIDGRVAAVTSKELNLLSSEIKSEMMGALRDFIRKSDMYSDEIEYDEYGLPGNLRIGDEANGAMFNELILEEKDSIENKLRKGKDKKEIPANLKAQIAEAKSNLAKMEEQIARLEADRDDTQKLLDAELEAEAKPESEASRDKPEPHNEKPQESEQAEEEQEYPRGASSTIATQIQDVLDASQFIIRNITIDAGSLQNQIQTALNEYLPQAVRDEISAQKNNTNKPAQSVPKQSEEKPSENAPSGNKPDGGIPRSEEKPSEGAKPKPKPSSSSDHDDDVEPLFGDDDEEKEGVFLNKERRKQLKAEILDIADSGLNIIPDSIKVMSSGAVEFQTLAQNVDGALERTGYHLNGFYQSLEGFKEKNPGQKITQAILDDFSSEEKNFATSASQSPLAFSGVDLPQAKLTQYLQEIAVRSGFSDAGKKSFGFNSDGSVIASLVKDGVEMRYKIAGAQKAVKGLGSEVGLDGLFTEDFLEGGQKLPDLNKVKMAAQDVVDIESQIGKVKLDLQKYRENSGSPDATIESIFENILGDLDVQSLMAKDTLVNAWNELGDIKNLLSESEIKAIENPRPKNIRSGMTAEEQVRLDKQFSNLTAMKNRALDPDEYFQNVLTKDYQDDVDSGLMKRNKAIEAYYADYEEKWNRVQSNAFANDTDRKQAIKELDTMFKGFDKTLQDDIASKKPESGKLIGDFISNEAQLYDNVRQALFDYYSNESRENLQIGDLKNGKLNVSWVENGKDIQKQIQLQEMQIAKAYHSQYKMLEVGMQQGLHGKEMSQQKMLQYLQDVALRSGFSNVDKNSFGFNSDGSAIAKLTLDGVEKRYRIANVQKAVRGLGSEIGLDNQFTADFIESGFEVPDLRKVQEAAQRVVDIEKTIAGVKVNLQDYENSGKSDANLESAFVGLLGNLDQQLARARRTLASSWDELGPLTSLFSDKEIHELFNPNPQNTRKGLSTNQLARLENQFVNFQALKDRALNSDQYYQNVKTTDYQYGDVEKVLMNRNEAIEAIFTEYQTTWDKVKNNAFESEADRSRAVSGLDKLFKNFKASVGKDPAYKGEKLLGEFQSTNEEVYANAQKALFDAYNNDTRKRFSVGKLKNGKIKAFWVEDGRDIQKTVQLQELIGEDGNSFYKMVETDSDEQTHLSAFDKFVGGMKTKFRTISQYLGSMVVIRGIMDQFRQGYDFVTTLDSALTNINMTMGASQEQLSQLGQAAIDTGRQYSTSAENVIQAATIYANANETVDSILEKATPTVLLSNASGVDTATSAQQIQAVVNQFKDLEGQETRVINAYEKISAGLAIDFADGINIMAEGVQNAGSIASESGLEFEDFAAIVGKVSERTRQDGGTIGNSLKTMMARISRSKTADEEVTGKDRSNAAAAYESVGIELYDSAGQYQDLSITLDQLASKWGTLTDAQRNYIAEQSAGTRGINIFNAMMDTYEDAKALADTTFEDTDFFEEVQGKYEESIAAHQEKLKATMQDFFSNLMQSGTIDAVFDFGTGVASVFTSIVSAISGATSAVTGFSSGLSGLLTVGTTLIGSGLGYDMVKAVLGKNEGETFGGALARKGKSVGSFVSTMFGGGGEKSLFKESSSPIAQFGGAVSKWFANGNNFRDGFSALKKAFNKGAEAYSGNLSEAFATVTEKSGNIISRTAGKAGALVESMGGMSTVLGIGIPAIAAAIGLGVAKYESGRPQREYDAGQKAVSEVKQTVNQNKSDKAFINEIKDEYINLQAGVNTRTGENVSLLNDQFERYLQLTSMIEERIPDLVTGYSDLGTAIIGNGNAYKAFNEQLATFDRKSTEEILNNEKDLVETFNAANETNIGYETDFVTKAKRDILEKVKGMDKDTFKAYMEKISGVGTSAGDKPTFRIQDEKEKQYLMDTFGDIYIPGQDIDSSKFSAIQHKVSEALNGATREMEESVEGYRMVMQAQLSKLLDENTTIKDRLSPGAWKNAETFLGELPFTTFEGMAKNEQLAEYVVRDFAQKLSNAESGPQLQKALSNLFSLSTNTGFSELAQFANEDLQTIINSIGGLDTESVFDMVGLQDAPEKIENYNKALAEYQSWTNRQTTRDIKESRHEAERLSKEMENSEESGLAFNRAIEAMGITTNAELQRLMNLLKEYKGDLDEIQKLWSVEGYDYDSHATRLSDLEAHIEEVREQYANMYAAMDDAYSSTGMTREDIGNIQSMFQNLEGYDYDTLFESTALGVRMNTTALRDLQKAYKDQQSATIQSEIDTLSKSYGETSKKISETTDSLERLKLVRQQNNIKSQLEQAYELQAIYEGINNTVSTWKQAASGSELYDNYQSIRDSGFKNAEELYKQHLVGTNEFRAFADLFTYKDLTNADVNEVVQAYEKNTPIAEKWFGEDNAQSMNNFLTDMEKIDKGIARLDENGSWKINEAGLSMEEMAEKADISTGLMQAMLENLEATGFEIDYAENDYNKAMRDDAKEALKAYNEMHDKDIEVDFKAKGQKDIQKQIDNLEKLQVDADTEEAKEQIQTMIDYFKSQLGIEISTKIDWEDKEVQADLQSTIDKINERFGTKIKIDFEITDAVTLQKELDELIEKTGPLKIDDPDYIEFSGLIENVARQTYAAQGRAWDEYEPTNKAQTQVLSKYNALDESLYMLGVNQQLADKGWDVDMSQYDSVIKESLAGIVKNEGAYKGLVDSGIVSSIDEFIAPEMRKSSPFLQQIDKTVEGLSNLNKAQKDNILEKFGIDGRVDSLDSFEDMIEAVSWLDEAEQPKFFDYLNGQMKATGLEADGLIKHMDALEGLSDAEIELGLKFNEDPANTAIKSLEEAQAVIKVKAALGNYDELTEEEIEMNIKGILDNSGIEYTDEELKILVEGVLVDSGIKTKLANGDWSITINAKIDESALDELNLDGETRQLVVDVVMGNKEISDLDTFEEKTAYVSYVRKTNDIDSWKPEDVEQFVQLVYGDDPNFEQNKQVYIDYFTGDVEEPPEMDADGTVHYKNDIKKPPKQNGDGEITFKNVFQKPGLQIATGIINYVLGSVAHPVGTTVVKQGATIVKSVASSVKNIASKYFPTGTATGTAHALGTAFAQGDWGSHYQGSSLVGELGPELIVRGRRFFTVGDNGAEFANIRQGDIIFNHKQTAEILKNGYVTSGNGRGRLIGANAHADGTALLEGTAFASYSPSGGGSLNVTTHSQASSAPAANNNGNNSGTGDAKDEFKEMYDWVEILIDRLERAIKRLDTTAQSTFHTFDNRRNDLAAEFEKVAEEITIQGQAYDTYINKAKSLGLAQDYFNKVMNGTLQIEDITDQKLYDLIKDVQGLVDKAWDCEDALTELNETLGEIAQARFDQVAAQFDLWIGQLEHSNSLLETQLEYVEAVGQFAGKSYFEALVKQQQEQMDKLEKQYQTLQEERFIALNTKAIAEGSEADLEMIEQINEVAEAWAEARVQLQEYKNDWLEMDSDMIDWANGIINRLTDEADFVGGLIGLNENWLFKKETGRLNDNGMTVGSLHAMNYDIYMAQADKYRQKVDELNAAIEKEPYNTKLIDARNEYLDLQQESIDKANEEKLAIRDLIKESYDRMLDVLSELIDKRKEELQAAKDLYDYEQKISDYTKEITDYRKQLLALQGDDSEEARKKRQEISEGLKNAEQELEASEYDQWLSDQEKLMDEMYTEFERVLNERLDNIDGLLREMIDYANSNSLTVNETIQSATEAVGYTVSDGMKEIWADFPGTINQILLPYSNNFTDIWTRTNDYVNQIYEILKNKFTDASAKAATPKPTDKTAQTVTMPTSTKPTTTTTNKQPAASTAPAKKNLTVGGMFRADGLPIYYDSYGRVGPNGSRQYFGSDPIYKFVRENNGYILGKWYKDNSASLGAGWFKKSDVTPLDTGGYTGEYDGMALLHKKERVLSARQTKSFETLVNDILPTLTNDFLSDSGIASLASATEISGGNYTGINGDVVMNLSLPNVKDADSFVEDLRNNSAFEQLIHHMTFDQMLGKSSLRKNLSRRK